MCRALSALVRCMTNSYSSRHITMNTPHSSHESPYPSLQPAWHKMIRRSRASERAIALALCRAAFQAGNSGCFPELATLSDTEISAQLQLTARQTAQLRRPSPLWRWNGTQLELFFYGAPAEEGAATPESYGKRRARHARNAHERERRSQRREQLNTEPPKPPYEIPDEDILFAAEDESDPEFPPRD